MDDFWVMFVFKLNTGKIYLVPAYSSNEDEGWNLMAKKLSRRVERTKSDAKLLHKINGAQIGGTKIIKL